MLPRLRLGSECELRYPYFMKLTAAIRREGPWWVAQCLEVDVASQGETVEAASNNLREALELYFEDGSSEPRQYAQAIITTIEVNAA